MNTLEGKMPVSLALGDFSIFSLLGDVVEQYLKDKGIMATVGLSKITLTNTATNQSVNVTITGSMVLKIKKNEVTKEGLDSVKQILVDALYELLGYDEFPMELMPYIDLEGEAPKPKAKTVSDTKQKLKISITPTGIKKQGDTSNITINHAEENSIDSASSALSEAAGKAKKQLQENFEDNLFSESAKSVGKLGKMINSMIGDSDVPPTFDDTVNYGGPKKAKPTKTVKLASATEIGQKVQGTSPTSVYYVVAICTGCNIAIRSESGTLSVRVEGKSISKYKDVFTRFGLADHGNYFSVHYSIDDLTSRRMTLGAMLCSLDGVKQALHPDNFSAYC